MNSFIASYADAANLWRTCRNPAKGKPLSSVYRLYHDGTSFYVTHYRSKVLSIHSDNTVEVHSLPPLNHFGVVSLVQTCVGRSRYRIAHLNTCSTPRGYCDWGFLRKAAPEFYPGIKFDMATGACINPKPDLKDRVLPEKSREWKRILSRYTAGIKIRSRLLARSNEELEANRPSLLGPVTLHLYSAMVSDEYPTELLDALTLVGRSYNDGLTPAQRMVRGFKRTVDANRNELRKMFGVFQE